MTEAEHPELAGLGQTRLPPWVERRVITIAAGGHRAYVESEWVDSLVLLAAGTIDLECHHGGVRSFRNGAILWLVGLPVHTIRNAGTETVVLVAISRHERPT